MLSALKSIIKNNILGIAFFILVAVIIYVGIENTAQNSSAEEIRTAKESVMRAVTACYAIEGSYPESYEYLKENYGVSVNESKYTVFYNIFASNILPDVEIIER